MNPLTPDIYQDLFRQYYAPLVKFAFSFCQNEAVAEDLVQQVFMQLWEKRASVVVHVSWKGYLYTTTRNRSLNYLRQKKQVLSLEAIDQVPGTQLTPQVMVEQTELGGHLHQALASLPSRCQEVFRLKRQEGLSYRQIAEQLNIAEKTVENQLGIALKKLREALKAYRHA